MVIVHKNKTRGNPVNNYIEVKTVRVNPLQRIAVKEPTIAEITAEDGHVKEPAKIITVREIIEIK